MKNRVKWAVLLLVCMTMVISGCGADSGESQFTQINSEYLSNESEEVSNGDAKDRIEDMEKEEKQKEGAEGTKKPEKKSESDEKMTSKKHSPEPENTERDEKKASERVSATKKPKATEKPEKSKKPSASKQPSATKKPSEQKEYCTISIDCISILDNLDKLKETKTAFVPKDGVILQESKIERKAGDTVYHILERACKKYKIHFESAYTPMYKSYYVEGIHQLYEFDCGNTSGWLYYVNGEKLNYASSKCKVQNGDMIEWKYSCNIGKDIS